MSDEVYFLHANKHESLLQTDTMILMGMLKHSQSSRNSKLMLSLVMGMVKHSQSTQSNKFAISFQYLKKEVRNGVNFFHADRHQCFYNLALFFLMEVTRHIQSTQIRKLVILLQYIQNNITTAFLFYCHTKRSHILRGCSHVRCYLFIFE